MSLSILHIAPQDFAGMPYELVKAERRRGVDSWLITMSPHPYGFDEDECLDLPFAAGGVAGAFQRAFRTTPKTVNLRRKDLSELPPRWHGNRFPANLFFGMRDALWLPRLRKAGFPKRLEKFDIVVLDGGLPLLRSGKWIIEWARRGGRLATIYYGTDLRQHGVLPAIDAAAGAVFVMEFDHTLIHPRGVWLPFPFDPSGLPSANPPDEPIRIGHVAARRSAKGTDRIIEAIEEVGRRIDVEPVIIEKMPHAQTLELKASCHIFVDQLGELGYGISGLESLAMGIPTVVQLLPDHEKFIGEHPFVVADSENLPEILETLATDSELREGKKEMGREWVKRFHDPNRAIDIILKKYAELGWLSAGELK